MKRSAASSKVTRGAAPPSALELALGGGAAQAATAAKPHPAPKKAAHPAAKPHAPAAAAHAQPTAGALRGHLIAGAATPR